MLRSFLCQGWEAKSEPDVQNLKDTRKKKKSEWLDLSSTGNPGCREEELTAISQPCAARSMPTSTREQTQITRGLGQSQAEDEDATAQLPASEYNRDKRQNKTQRAEVSTPRQADGTIKAVRDKHI